MAALQDLIAQIDDPILRERIAKEVDKLTKTKKFGLVFEEHIPECTPLYDIPVSNGCQIILRNRATDKSIYTVKKIENGQATCFKKEEPDVTVIFDLKDVVRIAEFGEPIYPYLEPIDSICNAPDSNLWHILIEADNYHALQLLEYLYADKVDCIYIDPPYNTGARDWKYNNDYVDSNDQYRHSKWLSMMEKRLKLAKKLLNPDDSVLIVTIDEKEYLHLGCLLEEMFSEANIQMISDVVNPSGTKRLNEFSRSDEYIFVVMLGDACPLPIQNGEEEMSVVWKTFRRGDLQSMRGLPKGGTAQFYPIYVNNDSGKIEMIGEPIAPDVDISSVPEIEGCTTVFPIRDNGTEMNWGTRPETAEYLLSHGYIKAAGYSPEKPQQYSIQYLTSGTIRDIEDGRAVVHGYDENGGVIASYLERKTVMPKTNWDFKQHNASSQGSKILDSIFPNKRFNFPKSIYSVFDVIRLFVADKPSALIVDFFAGSGTTLHAVNLLNVEDGGHRQCIMITNNEVSESEEKILTEQGFHQGDPKWEQHGIARYVTWPRTVCSIEGHDVNGNPLEGNYGIETEAYESDNEVQVVSQQTGRPIKKTVYKKIKRQMYPKLASINMSDGFKSNAVYFKLGFLDKTTIALGIQFKEMIPTLWMKAGSIGPCPTIDTSIPNMLVLPENHFAVLNNEDTFSAFAEELNKYPEIQTVFLVTDYEVNYRSMVKGLNVETTYQLYRDYLDNFRINHERN